MIIKLSIFNLYFQLEKLITKNYYLHKSAKEGYRSYLQAYASHQHRDIFNVNTLDLQKVAKAFGFQVPPAVNLGILLRTQLPVLYKASVKIIK